MKNKNEIPTYFGDSEIDELRLYTSYMFDCSFLRNLAIHAMAHRGKREVYLTQMEEGAKTLLSYIEKIREVHAKLAAKYNNDK